MSQLIYNYIDNLVEKIAKKEGGCSRNRKAEKVEFWIHRPNGYGLAKGKIKSKNVQPLHNANRKHKS
jgi:hypothetical protein